MTSTEIADLSTRVERLEKVLGTLITWLHGTLGTASVVELLRMLEGRDAVSPYDPINTAFREAALKALRETAR